LFKENRIPFIATPDDKIAKVKVAENNTESRNRYWAKYSPEGKTDKFGKPKENVGFRSHIQKLHVQEG
jgi:hypothetical protein